MTDAPQIPLYSGNLPTKTQSQSTFDANIVDWEDYQEGDLVEGINDAVSYINTTAAEVAATAMSGDLPDITGQGGKYLVVNSEEDGVEFNGINKLADDVTSLSVGRVTSYAHFGGGYRELYCDGSEHSREGEARLFAKIGTTYGEGDGSTTFNVPDGRGVSVRGMDDGRGLDPDGPTRTVGSYQEDAFQGHGHNIVRTGTNYSLFRESGSSSDVEGTGSTDAANVSTTSIASALSATTPERLGSNGTPRISIENRMKNIAFYWFIQA